MGGKRHEGERKRGHLSFIIVREREGTHRNPYSGERKRAFDEVIKKEVIEVREGKVKETIVLFPYT